MNFADLKIIDFREEHADDVLQIQAETGLSFWSKSDYLSEVERNDSIFKIARAGERITGFALVRLLIGNSAAAEIAFDSAELLNIAVRRALQKKGVGQMIFDEVLAALKARGVAEIWLEVRASNAKAIAFYQRNGFERRFERKNYYSNPVETALVFRRQIED